jgi:TolA-binding protein
MSTPAETTPTQDPGFDPLAFWIENKSKVKLLATVAAVGLLGSGIYQYAEYHSRQTAAAAFGAAKSPEDFKKVIREFPNSPVSGNAMLLLAEALRKEGKLDDALTTLRQFTSVHQSHTMISGAWNSIALILELQGKKEEALSAYQKITTAYPSSFAAPMALLGRARISAAKGENDQAKLLFEQVVSQFAQSRFAQQALEELQKLKPAAPAQTAASAPATSTAPADASPAATPESPKAPQPPAPTPAPANPETDGAPAKQ